MSVSEQISTPPSREILPSKAFEQVSTLTSTKTVWRVVIRSITGREKLCTITITPRDTPQTVIEKLRAVYQAKISRRKRFLDRYILLHKPVIMSARLSAMSQPKYAESNQQITPRVFISSPSRDDTLTAAFHKPQTLSSVDQSLFFSEYVSFAVGQEAQGPARACVIAQEVDRRTVVYIRVTLMVVSLTLGIVGGCGV